jgi:hypothetical protein
LVAAAGAAFVAMTSSAADTWEHVASRRNEPVNAVRQAVQAIVPSYDPPSKFWLPKLLSGPCQPLLDRRASDFPDRNASRSDRLEPLTGSGADQD